MKYLLVFSGLLAICSALTVIEVPSEKRLKEPSEDAIRARYVVNNVVWAMLVSRSSMHNISAYPFANVKAISDGPLGEGRGTPYAYMTNYDLSAHDIREDPRCAIGVTMAETDFCKKHDLDDQDPRCTRVVLTGILVNVTRDDSQFANMSIMNRHPQIATYPAYHYFYLLQLDINYVAMLNGFGGPKVITVEDYYSVRPKDLRDYAAKHALKLKRQPEVNEPTFWQKAYHSLRNRMNNLYLQPKRNSAFVGIPKPWEDVKMSRYIVQNSDWATVGTISNLKTLYDSPFAHVASISDGPQNKSTGIPYLYISPLESLVANVNENPRMSLAISLGQTSYCKEMEYDETDPRCPRIIFEGRFRKVDPNSEEHALAIDGLFARHPSMKDLPETHHFFVATVDIEKIFLLSRLGPFMDVPLDKYLAGK